MNSILLFLFPHFEDTVLKSHMIRTDDLLYIVMCKNNRWTWKVFREIHCHSIQSTLLLQEDIPASTVMDWSSHWISNIVHRIGWDRLYFIGVCHNLITITLDRIREGFNKIRYITLWEAPEVFWTRQLLSNSLSPATVSSYCWSTSGTRDTLLQKQMPIREAFKKTNGK